MTGGRRKEWRGRLVSPPVERTSTILFDSVADMRQRKPGLGSYAYGLQGTASHWALAEALTELEPGAAGTALLPSGLAAITAAMLAVLSAGDEVLVVDSVYGPTRIFCDKILSGFGIAARYYDPLATPEALESLVGESTRAILLESPGSLTFEVQDVPGICAMARRRGLTTILDNTWATPLLFPAIAVGVDISILAVSKHVGGHSDLLMGAVTATPEWFERIQHTAWDLGHAVSPDDAWLASRGLRTLGVRLRQHEHSGLAVAKWLDAHAAVGTMLHPALPDCPGHALWQRDFRGSSGLFAFSLLNADRKARDAVVDRLQLFGIGYSWGGFESLAIPVDPVRTVGKQNSQPLIRLHIGLEDADDLIADLEQALSV
ncbi:cystathionine beta-lyase [Sphingomonas sinipercae]|uniref:cystathionine beta-lyase n=1 Tax=Sphingomonas sinipercae TaxID=2714944 RepID=UPI003CCE4BC9